RNVTGVQTCALPIYECTEIHRMVIMIVRQEKMMQFIQPDMVLDVCRNTAPHIQQNRETLFLDEISRRRFILFWEPTPHTDYCTFHRRHSNSICFSLITILSANCYITVYIMKVAIGWFVATYSV